MGSWALACQISGDTILICHEASAYRLAEPKWVASRARQIGADRFPAAAKRSGGVLWVWRAL